MSDAPRGHIKIARKAFDKLHGDVWFLEKRAFSKWEAWLDMIHIAQFAPRELVTTKFGTVKLERGEFVMSQRMMAERWGWTRQMVRTFVGSVEFNARIHTRSPHSRHRSAPLPATNPATQAGTVYLIVNYDTYQSSSPSTNPANNPPSNQPPTNLQPTSNPRDKQLSSKAITTTDYPADFEMLWSVYPKRRGNNPKSPALHAYNARLKEGISYEAMFEGTKRYAAYLLATGRVGTEYVMQAKRFLGTERPFAEEWEVPPTTPSTNGSGQSRALTSRDIAW